MISSVTRDDGILSVGPETNRGCPIVSCVCVFLHTNTHCGPFIITVQYEVLSLFTLGCRNKWTLQMQLNVCVCVCWKSAGRKLWVLHR